MKITPVGADTYVGELDDKNTGPNHWKRNQFTWHLLQKCAVWNKSLEYHTYLVQQFFARSLNKAIRKTSIKFHIPSLNKCQLVSLIFKNIESVSWDRQKLFQYPLPEKKFPKSCSPIIKFPRNVFQINSQNIGISNWQLWSSIKSNSQKYCWVGWLTCLHVAGSRIVLQCFVAATKYVTVYWCRFLPLVN